ncbi:MAG: hypothetical protein ABRQ39_08680 [Candidatus Eremiobacterota bacterium]
MKVKNIQAIILVIFLFITVLIFLPVTGCGGGSGTASYTVVPADPTPVPSYTVIQGYVYDSSGNPAGAGYPVTLKPVINSEALTADETYGEVQTAYTDAKGFFIFRVNFTGSCLIEARTKEGALIGNQTFTVTAGKVIVITFGGGTIAGPTGPTGGTGGTGPTGGTGGTGPAGSVNTGQITVIVKDQRGNNITGATISLMKYGLTGSELIASEKDMIGLDAPGTGSYTFTDLPCGFYKITAEYTDCEKVEATTEINGTTNSVTVTITLNVTYLWVTGYIGSTIFEIDYRTGAFVTKNTYTLPGDDIDVVAMDINPVSKKLYVLSLTTSNVEAYEELYSLDPQNGFSATKIARVSIPEGVSTDITFDKNGKLYGMSNGHNAVYEINLTDGSITPCGAVFPSSDLPEPYNGGIACDGNICYAKITGGLYTANLQPSTWSMVNNTMPNIRSLDFSDNGVLYGSASGSSVSGGEPCSLYRINAKTGACTTLATAPFDTFSIGAMTCAP